VRPEKGDDVSSDDVSKKIWVTWCKLFSNPYIFTTHDALLQSYHGNHGKRCIFATTMYVYHCVSSLVSERMELDAVIFGLVS